MGIAMTDTLFAALKSVLTTADTAFSRVFQAFWHQTLSEHRRFAQRHRAAHRLAHFS